MVVAETVGAFSIKHVEMFVNGSLVLIVDEGSFGDALLNISLIDDGGTLRNGSDTSGTKQLLVQIKEVNNAPSFVLRDPVVRVNEDQGDNARLVLNAFASNISAGAQELDQNLTFVIEAVSCRLFAGESSCNAGDLFSPTNMKSMFSPGTSISISPDGNLSFNLNAYMNGWVNFSVFLRDSGSVRMSSASSSKFYFELFILPVNSAPTFTLSRNVTILEDSSVILDKFATTSR
jgi:hypothetical protein